MSAPKIIAMLAALSIFTAACEEKNLVADQIIPKTTFAPVADAGAAHPQISDMYKIILALELYKLDHRSYPMSSRQGEGWDGILSRYGESREDWIQGLVPEYISELPVDPRNPASDKHQFIYKSNGANYKLIVHSSSDCEFVRTLYPATIDPKRNCYAYGFWTKRAARW